MIRSLSWSLPLLALAACSASGGAGPMGSNAGGNTTGAGGSSGSDSDNGSAGSPNKPATFQLACSEAAAGKPVLRVLNRAQFTRTLQDVFPQVATAWTTTLPGDPVSAYGFDNDGSTVVGPQLAQALLDTGTAVATAVTGSALAAILPCSTSSADRACAQQFVTQYGRRLFRRPLSQPERDRYLTFFDSALAKSDFKTALKWVTVGLIQSPNAVYRSEIGSVANGGRQLEAHELATELAYTYTGSTPSEALLAQADSGQALDVKAVAKSLLATDPGKATLQDFFQGYLDYARVASVDRSGVPQWSTVRGQMLQETRSFIEQIVIKNGGGLKELLTSPTSNPSQSLAAYYGFPSPASDNASVPRTSGQGIGVLAQGSLLSSRAQPNGSSPTQRGLLVFSRLLCNVKPEVPPNVPNIPSPAPGVTTTRDRYEKQHAANVPCSSCHKLFDPIGFGFEHFDEGGRFRASENGLPINSVSSVPVANGGALFDFTGQEELARGLAEQEVVYQCFAAHMATYAFGTGEPCLGASRVSDLKAGTLSIVDFYAALAAEPHFTRRDVR